METSTADTTGLKTFLRAMFSNLESFSFHILSLYDEYEVPSGFTRGTQFKKVRDDTANEALKYFRTTLPVGRKLVEHIDDYFDFYQNHEFGSFVDRIDIINSHMSSFKSLKKELLRITSVQQVLKEKSLKFNLVESEVFSQGQSVQSNKVHVACAKSFNLFEWIMHLVRRNVVKNTDTANYESASFDEKHIQKVKEAVTVVKEKLIPSAVKFIDALENLSKIFCKIENDLNKILDILKEINADASKTDCVKFRTIDSGYGTWNSRKSTPCFQTHQSKIPIGIDDNYLPNIQGHGFEEHNDFEEARSGQAYNMSLFREFTESYETLRDYHKLMKNAADEIHESCTHYYNVLPNIESNLVTLKKFINSPV